MEIGYVGGIDCHGMTTPERPGWARWSWTGARHDAFLTAGGAGCRLFDGGKSALVVRGLVVDTGSPRPNDVALLGAKLLSAYRESGTLAIDGLEGSFTLVLLDGPAGRVLAYRNLVGDSNTYYRSVGSGMVFASNLADLIECCGDRPRANDADLPTLFLNRTVPGRNTLFEGYHRLLPGEQLKHENGRLTRIQRSTLGDLRESRPIGREALDRLEETVSSICRDQEEQDPETASLLSGGVDSSFLALHRIRSRGTSGGPTRSFCVAVDHDLTRGDRDYAESAARRLGTDHTVVLASDPYAEYLHETLASTAEMPNHVQLAYYPVLAAEMREAGVRSAVNGDGADSLFGLGLATPVQIAALLRRLFPMRLLRRAGATMARWMGRDRLHGYFALAELLHDYENLDHPVNRAAVFADWPAAEACFGKEAVARVAADRRALLDLYQVPDSPQERLHAAGFLGSAMNTAALTTTMYARAGIRTFTPFLDSRMLRLAINLSPHQRFRFRQPKALLKESLARHGFADLAYRSKLSFGQPVFEWLAPGGQLSSLVADIADYPFVDAETLARTRARPTWFLYTLLCYDVWHRMFVRGEPAPALATLTR